MTAGTLNGYGLFAAMKLPMDIFQLPIGDVRIYLGGGNIAVAKQFLD